MHDDVDLLLECTQLEALELMTEDPGYYLKLVENYKTRRDGTTVHLPYELNTNINHRSDGRLIIQFKLDRNGRWYEVGYDGADGFTDEDVYRAFTEKVKFLIKYPPPERAHLCEQALGDPTNVSEYQPTAAAAEEVPQLPDFLKPVSTRAPDASVVSAFDAIVAARNQVPPVVPDFKALPSCEVEPFSNGPFFQAIIDLVRATPEHFKKQTDQHLVNLLITLLKDN